MLLSRITWHPTKRSMPLSSPGLVHQLQEAILQRSSSNIHIGGPSIVAIVGHNIGIAISRIIVLFDKTGASKARKTQIEQVEGLVSQIARKGRAAGCHVILAGQRLDAATVPPHVRSNLSCRICGRADEILSNIVLDSRVAADLIPSDAPGRFVLSNGANSYTVFQSYKFDERRQ